MTVYVDQMFIPATVGGHTSRWCHLTADTKDELHAFAARIGLRRSYFQTCKRSRACRPAEQCVHWHYDVTEGKRHQAVRLGAVEINRQQMVDLLRARRANVPDVRS
jgi:hypothetical protein